MKKDFPCFFNGCIKVEVQGKDRSSGSEYCPHNITTHSYVLQICPINKENQARSTASLVQWNIHPAFVLLSLSQGFIDILNNKLSVWGRKYCVPWFSFSILHMTSSLCPHAFSLSVWSLDKQTGNVGESHNVKDPLLFYSPFASSTELPVSQAPSHTSHSRPLTSCLACIRRPFHDHGLSKKIGRLKATLPQDSEIQILGVNVKHDQVLTLSLSDEVNLNLDKMNPGEYKEIPEDNLIQSARELNRKRIFVSSKDNETHGGKSAQKMT